MLFCKNLPCKMYYKTKNRYTLFSQGTNNYDQLNLCVHFELQAHFAEVQAYIYNKTQGKTQLHRQYLWFRYKETILADNVFSFHQLQANICTDVKCY